MPCRGGEGNGELDVPYVSAAAAAAAAAAPGDQAWLCRTDPLLLLLPLKIGVACGTSIVAVCCCLLLLMLLTGRGDLAGLLARWLIFFSLNVVSKRTFLVLNLRHPGDLKPTAPRRTTLFTLNIWGQQPSVCTNSSAHPSPARSCSVTLA